MENKRVALYFGSFNPIHYGHTSIAEYVAGLDYIDEVRFIVSPQNPDKVDWDNCDILGEEDRFKLIERAIKFGREENPDLTKRTLWNKINVSNIEFNLPKPSYTYNTLLKLKELEPNNKFYIVMGSDNLSSLHCWKNYEDIVNLVEGFLVLERKTDTGGFYVLDGAQPFYHKVTFLKHSPINISSTEIRNNISTLAGSGHMLTTVLQMYLQMLRTKFKNECTILSPKNKNREFNFKALENYKFLGLGILFLAGPCPRHEYSSDWRHKFIEDLKASGFHGIVITPTNDQYDENNPEELKMQTNWELEAMKASDRIFFNLDRSFEHPGFTTNIEVGYWLGRNAKKIEKSLIFYCPEGNTLGSNRYIKIKAEEGKYPWLTDINKAIQVINEGSFRSLSLNVFNFLRGFKEDL